MSLLYLPPEILRRIFDYISSPFFHEDLSRLTVCKEWFNFAVSVCFKCIALDQRTLRSLATSGIASKPGPLKDSLETLDLKLEGNVSCTTPHFQEYAKQSISLEPIAPNETSRASRVRAWIQALNLDLAQLAMVAQQSRRLRNLCVRARICLSPEPLDRPEDYLSLKTMKALLAVENLNFLVLDLSGSSLISSEKQGVDSHICPTIGALLNTLRVLHLRIRSICPDVLIPRDTSDRLSLSVIVINLSLSMNLPETTSVTHAKRCGHADIGLPLLKADMKEQAETLVTRMASPQIMRILTHTLPKVETQSLDVLTGRTRILDNDMAWDNDGDSIEEDSEPESEILDDDFSTSAED